ncbi:MAG: ChbG/HpnK family deacetylase [Myxococcota bacterium]|nr:ChbG/HpnK family deacetylase [Myxococcota bacterium]
MGEARTTPGARLVVTADDAGLRGDWDRAIFAAHEAGVVTAVSVVTNGPVYLETRARLRDAPALDPGVHLNAIAGLPLSPCGEVRTLVNDDGRLCGSIGRFLLRFLPARIDAQQLAREWERQVQRALDDGLRPTHLNSHYHVHLLPGLFDVTLALARRHGIRWVRVADEPPWPPAGGRLRLLTLFKTSGLWLAARGCHAKLARAGLGHGVSSRGTGTSGRLGPGEWAELLSRLDTGTTEIVCHPGQSPQEEAALASAELPGELARQAVLCRFRDLAADA